MWNAITWPRHDLKINKSANNKELRSLVKERGVISDVRDDTHSTTVSCSVTLDDELD